MPNRFLFVILLSGLVLGLAWACRTSPAAPAQEGEPSQSRRYAIAIHGGAGVISKTLEQDKGAPYEASLSEALRLGVDMLEQGGSALDVVEQVVRRLEDDPLFNAGKGAVFNFEGRHELDAAVMDGRSLACGAVSGVTTVRNPITLARLVMERTNHVLLTAEGAERFADQVGVERVDQGYYFTEKRHRQWKEQIENAKETGTVGAVVLDQDGNLAAATSTGGMTGKRFGRVGDSPIIGAGTYANNKTVAISATGSGEEFIRHVVAYDISALMEYKGLSLQKAAEEVIKGKLKSGDGGIIAVSSRGELALVFNSEGMFRGAADSGGRFEVKIWD